MLFTPFQKSKKPAPFFLVPKMDQLKILADFVNIYLQEVLIELSKVGKLCSKAAVSPSLGLDTNHQQAHQQTNQKTKSKSKKKSTKRQRQKRQG